MSQDVFAALLAALAVAGVGAVFAYIALNTADRRLQLVFSFGLMAVPWWRIRLPRRGRHAADAWESFRDWLDSGTVATTTRPFTFGLDLATPDGALVAIDHHGRVHTSQPRVYHGGSPTDSSSWAVPGHWQDPEAASTAALDELAETLRTITAEMTERPLDIRAAEILAHEDNATAVVPERTAEGATEDWSPLAEVAAMRPPVVLVRSEPDDAEKAILAALDRVCGDLVTVPDWQEEWARRTDAYLEAAGLNAEPHRRWRQGALEFPTTELPRVLATA